MISLSTDSGYDTELWCLGNLWGSNINLITNNMIVEMDCLFLWIFHFIMSWLYQYDKNAILKKKNDKNASDKNVVSIVGVSKIV
jgi:hypothetical protein